MNMNNDTNVVVLTGQVSKIQKVQQGDAFMVELELIVKKQIKTGMKLSRFKVVFFGEEAVDVDRSVTVTDAYPLSGNSTRPPITMEP